MKGDDDDDDAPSGPLMHMNGSDFNKENIQTQNICSLWSYDITTFCSTQIFVLNKMKNQQMIELLWVSC